MGTGKFPNLLPAHQKHDATNTLRRDSSESTDQPVFSLQLAGELAKKLQGGHGSGCAWRGNACDENLLSYPPIPQAQAVATYHERLTSITQLSELPKLAPAAVKAITATHRCPVRTANRIGKIFKWGLAAMTQTGVGHWLRRQS